MARRTSLSAAVAKILAPLPASDNEIPVGPLSNWTPTHLVLCKIILTPVPGVADPKLTFCTKTSYVYRLSYLAPWYSPPDQFNIAQFAMDVRNKATLPPPQLDSRLTFEADNTASPPNFTIKGPCYIVFAIETDGWQFTNDGPAIGLPQKGEQERYANLYQLPPQTAGDPIAYPVPGDAFKDDGCHVAYFSAALVTSNAAPLDPLDLSVSPEGSHSALSFPIDPDIKNDGTNPNWPP